MFRQAAGAGVRALAAGVLAAVLLFIGARWWMPGTVHGPIAEGAWTARSRALFTTTGFFRPEFHPQTERHFSWTTDDSRIDFATLSRSVAYQVTLTVRGSRPPGVPAPELQIFVDDQRRLVAHVANDTQQIQFDLPKRSGVGAAVTLHVAPLFVPGGADPRGLGIVVDDVAITAAGEPPRPVGAVYLKLIAAVSACGLGLWCLGLRGSLFAAMSSLIAVGFAWLLTRDAAFAGTYSDRLLRIGLAAGGIAALIGAVRLRSPRLGGVAEWPVACGIVLAPVVVLLALFWHPLVMVGDAFFQVHRAQAVHNGNYFFTSVTPRPFFEFPYPVALYVAAQPFWSWFPTELDLARLLRALSLVADALVGVALYAAIRRQTDDRRVAFAAAALWPLARAPLEALANANLTNLFGQGVFGIALGGIAWFAAAGVVSWPALIMIGALLVVAFLSHFGTVTVGLVILASVIAALAAFGRGPVRRAGLWIGAVTIAAAALSWFVYYSHPTFKAVYQKTYASVSAGERDDSSKIVAAPIVKLQRWWSGVGDDYGRPGILVLMTTLAGLVIALRRRPREGPTLVFAAWIAAWLGLSALGIFTAITLRANLATAPAFVFFCAIGLGALAARSRGGTLMAIALGLVIAWDGWRIALNAIALSR